MRIEVVRGDIFEQDVDAIVNPANEHLLHGGGLAGAIARRAGPRFWQESDRVAPVRTGSAVETTAGLLPFRLVIHAVGPVWGVSLPDESDALLAKAHISALIVADWNGMKSVAFPAVSCGLFGYPVERAAPVAIRSVRAFDPMGGLLERVVFVLPEKREYKTFRKALRGRWWRFWR